MNDKHHIAVVIPAFRCKSHIVQVVESIPTHIKTVVVVDDCCPEKTGSFLLENSKSDRLYVVHLEQNQGVGGAVLAGMQKAHSLGAEIFVKVDGDGQMDPSLIPQFTRPIEKGLADYTKGNRFFRITYLSQMPHLRIFGNAVLTLMCRFSSGYWHISDPTNGYLAIHRAAFEGLEHQRVAKRFFFESDILYHLNLLRAVVVDVPMKSVYGDEISNLKISKIMMPFLWGHSRNFIKRVLYTYFIRSLSVGSLFLLLSIPLLLIGGLLGISKWIHALQTSEPTPIGTVVLVALLIIIGFQMIVGFLQEDMGSTPKVPFHLLWRQDP